MTTPLNPTTLSNGVNPSTGADSLLARIDASTPATRPDYTAPKVNSAFKAVKQIFGQDIVWRNDLSKVSSVLAKLSPAERQSFVNLCARQKTGRTLTLLQEWVGRVTKEGLGDFDGLDASTRMKLWRTLVPGQDGKNLARIFDAAKGATEARLQPFRQEFAKAVASVGTSDQKLAFIKSQLPAALAQSSGSDQSSARAIATVMSTLTNPAQLSAAVALLGRSGVDAAVKSTLQARGDEPAWVHEANAAKVDLTLFKTLAQRFAASTNPREKAAFVSASGSVLKYFNSTVIGPNFRRQELGEATAAVARVIDTDTPGVIENTMLQNTSGGASGGPAALRIFSQALLDSGRGEVLGAITLRLQRGQDLTQDPMTYLGERQSRSGEAPTYSRARVLGGWLGVVGSAVQARINQRDSNAAYSSLIFTGSIDVMKELASAAMPNFKVAFGVLAPALKTAVNLGLFNWRNEATRTDRSFAQSLLEGALPKHRNGVEATAPWTETLKTEQARRLSNF